MLDLDILTTFNRDNLWLEISSNQQETAWKQAQNCTNSFSRWQGYLNALSLNGMLSWLNSMLEEEIATSYFPQDKLPSYWEFVNGTAIEIGEIRIVLIPQDTEDLEEICIPQEWLNIPNWVADYYIGVAVNPDDNWLRFWGYASYDEVKNIGVYNPINRCYSLSFEDLKEDINFIVLAREFCLPEKPILSRLEKLSTNISQELLSQLKATNIPWLRLIPSLENWQKIISDDNLREKLYQVRKPLNLTAWLQGNFQQAIVNQWQNLEEFWQDIQLSSSANLTPQFAMRYSINPIDIIYNSNDESSKQIAAQSLISLANTTQEITAEINQAIVALSYLIKNSQDEETRWIAAESLLLLDSSNSAAGIWRGKEMKLGNHNLFLVIALLPKSDVTTSIFLRLYPKDSETLPININLKILDSNGEVFEEITTRNADNLIQYKFWAEAGEEFSISISLEEDLITEYLALYQFS